MYVEEQGTGCITGEPEKCAAKYELQIKMQNNSILTPTSSSSATPGTRFLVRATSFVRQALQAQQKRMESPDVVAQNADVAADDAGSGGTALDMDQLTREALVNLLSPFSRGVGDSSAAVNSLTIQCLCIMFLERQLEISNCTRADLT